MKVRLLKNMPHLRLRQGAIGTVITSNGTMHLVHFGVRKVHLFVHEVEKVEE